MGSGLPRGRPPTPAALLELRGAYKHDPQRRRAGVPKPALATAEPPADLEPEVRRVWQRTAPDLVSTGVLTVVDVPLLVTYCQATVALERAAAMMLADPSWVATHGKLLKVWLALAAKFGLTPQDRERLGVGLNVGNTSLSGASD